MNNTHKVWYSYNGKKYDNNAPPYYDLTGTEWYDKLKKNLPQVREQLTLFLNKDGVNPQEYFNKTLVDGTRWDVISFMFWNLRNKKNIEQGKYVFEYFKNIPGMVSLSVSILQPKTHIKGHNGDTNAMYRLHIPIYIPAQLPDCGFSVSGITKPWIENEIIVFNDACFHEAWNMTDQPRVILIMDVIKEHFLPQTDNVCANVLSYMAYQHFYFKNKKIKKMPGWMKRTLRNILKAGIILKQFANNTR